MLRVCKSAATCLAGKKLDFFGRVYSNKLQVDSHGDVTLANARRARFLRAARRRMMKWPLLPPGRDTHYIALAFPHVCLTRVRTPPCNSQDTYENETENSLFFVSKSFAIESILNWEIQIFLKINFIPFIPLLFSNTFFYDYSDFS